MCRTPFLNRTPLPAPSYSRGTALQSVGAGSSQRWGKKTLFRGELAGQACHSPMAVSGNGTALETHVLGPEGPCLSLGSEELGPEEREMSC